MNMLHVIAYTTLSASILFAGPSSPKQNPELQEVISTGKQSSKLLLKTLGSNLKRNLKAGGPMQALEFCTQKAYTLTEDVNKKLPKGVSVKRISTKFRNPLNKPQESEQEVLETLEKLQELHVKVPKHLIQKVDEKTYKYYKPLLINKQVCLQCHGDIKNANLERAIDERYPQDKAKHYKMGDLRGAVVVTVKKSVK